MIPILGQTGTQPQVIPILAPTNGQPQSASDPDWQWAPFPHNANPTKASPEDIALSANFHTFFQSRPPPVEKAPGHTMSTNTRDVNFFDMHLHPDLRLKRVVFLDDLPATLSKFCDKLVQNPSGLPPASPDVFLVDYQEGEKIVDEKTLQEYWLTVSESYSRVASGLYFKNSWDSHFNIDRLPSGARRDFAIADGYLSPIISESLSTEQREDLELLKKHGLSNVLIWEFKSLACGPHILQNLRDLVEGDFAWTGCQERSVNDEPSVACGYATQAHRVEGRLSVTGRRTGPDSTTIIDFLQLPVDPDAQETKRNPNLQHLPISFDHKPLAGSKRSLDAHDAGSHKRQKTSMDAMNTDTTVHAVEKNTDLDDARRVVQQTWAEAVIEDATFVIISAGNEEYIGVRHRETQTLYLSPLIRPSEDTAPAHAKLQVAVFVAALEDALNRARQMQAIATMRVPQGFPSRFLVYMDKGPSPSEVVAELQKRKIPINDPPVQWDSTSFLERMTKSSAISVRFHTKPKGQRTLVTTPSNPNTWILNRLPTTGTKTNSTHVSNPTLFLDYEDEFRSGAKVHQVYAGFVEGHSNPPRYHSKRLVMKIACNPYEKVRLQKEYDMYKLFLSSEVASVVKAFGLFSCVPIMDGEEHLFLLLEDGGKSIKERSTGQMKGHLRKHGLAYTNAITSLHRKGFVHKNINNSHVLLDVGATNCKPKFISLAECERSESLLDQKTDIRFLDNALGRPSEATQQVDQNPQAEVLLGERDTL